jgi:dihydrofolate synthase/folylpolyglutamate synthase
MKPVRLLTVTEKAACEVDFPYYNAVDQIYHVEWTLAKLARLELLRDSIAALWPNGHPTRLVHVAGTGGKGSTCRFLELGFGCVGKAGAFMSPHLFDYRERFSIGGEFVSRADVLAAWERRVRPHCVALALRNPQQTHTFHEVSILIALALFEQHGVQWAAMETGVGGRYDQTRALDVAATVLTNVGSDHSHMLGDELWQRVLDKAGIARPGVPFFTSERNPASLEIVADVCAHEGAPLHIVDQIAVDALGASLAAHTLAPSPESLLHADYQKWNAALALAVVRTLAPAADEAALLRAFANARLLGRFWKVEEDIYADIAHNAEKIDALSGEIRKQFGDAGKIVVVGISGQRVSTKVFRALAEIAHTIIVTSASFKGQDPARVREEVESIVGDIPVLMAFEPQQALRTARSLRRPGDVIILTGSTYMIEQALNPDPYLRYLSAHFGWRTAEPHTATGTMSLEMPKPAAGLR